MSGILDEIDAGRKRQVSVPNGTRSHPENIYQLDSPETEALKYKRQLKDTDATQTG